MKKSTENEEKKLTISDITEEVMTEICEKYCRFPFELEQDELDKRCSDCPLNRLV